MEGQPDIRGTRNYQESSTANIRMAKKSRNTTSSGMTNVSFRLYSGNPRGSTTAHHLISDTWPLEAPMDNDTSFGGYEVPVDPMDLLQCDSCQ